MPEPINHQRVVPGSGRRRLISDLDHPPITRALDVQGSEVFAFRQGCSYWARLEAWYVSDRAAMGRVMEIESYQGMLACVVAGSGGALMPASMLASMPGRENARVHPLQQPFASATTWLMWRKGRVGANLNAWIELQQARPASVSALQREVSA